jgi:hypothetical protein
MARVRRGLLVVGAAAAGLAVAAGAGSADSTRLVLGQSIGAASVGGLEKQVKSAYGRPVSQSAGSYGGKPFRLAVYAVAGGKLHVFSDRTTKVVVGLATTSPRYRTDDGFGVGSPAAAARARGFRWNAQCTLTYLKTANGMFMELVTRARLRTGPIAQIYFIRAAYAGDC